MVVADIPPVHSLVAAVMEGVGQPRLLLESGASAHHFQLRPSQAAAVAGADLVVWIGPELAPWLEAALANRPEGAAELALLAAEGTYRQGFAADAPEAAGHDDHAAGHDHGATDPHAWLDPENGKAWLRLIAAELSRLDPENAAAYAANAARGEAAIAAADAAAARLLRPVASRPFVVYHDGYGYFAAHYRLALAGSVAEGDAAAPGAAHLAALQALLASGAVACVFPEAQHDPAALQRLAEGTAATVGAALDPIGSTLAPGPGLYPALLLDLAQKIAACGAPPAAAFP